MTIVDKYLTREIIKFFLIVLAAVAGMYLISEIFTKIDDILPQDVPIAVSIGYFLLQLPMVVSQITPVCILLAVLIVFGLMNKNNEIIALKSGGISVYYLLRPVIGIGFLLCICQFFLTEAIVPGTTSKSNRIWLSEIRKKSFVTSKQKNIWIKGKRSIYHITYYNPQQKMISGISLNYFDEDFRMIKRIEAKQGVFENERWRLIDIMEQELDKETGNYAVSFYDTQIIQLDFLPEDLKRVVKKSQEMNFWELYSYIQDIRAEGYDATAYEVDFQAKFAFPLICIIMGFVGTGIAVKRRAREGLSLNIAYGLGAVFLYWVSHSFCMSLGYGGVLPPVIAAWITNIIFLCLGLFNLLNAQ